MHPKKCLDSYFVSDTSYGDHGEIVDEKYGFCLATRVALEKTSIKLLQ